MVLTGNFTSGITVGIFLPWGCAKVLRSFQRLSKGEASLVISHVFTLVNAETHLSSQLIGPARSTRVSHEAGSSRPFGPAS